MNNPFTYGGPQIAQQTAWDLEKETQRKLDGHMPCTTCGHSVLWHGDRALGHCGARDETYVIPGVGYRQICICQMYKEEKP